MIDAAANGVWQRAFFTDQPPLAVRVAKAVSDRDLLGPSWGKRGVPLTDPVQRVADLINHPPHYTSHPSGVEVITFTEHMGFCLGNVVKYVLRADEKGSAVADLKKAAWYLNREIAKREAAL